MTSASSQENSRMQNKYEAEQGLEAGMSRSQHRCVVAHVSGVTHSEVGTVYMAASALVQLVDMARSYGRCGTTSFRSSGSCPQQKYHTQQQEQEEIRMTDALAVKTQEPIWRYLRSGSNFYQVVMKGRAREKWTLPRLV